MAKFDGQHWTVYDENELPQLECIVMVNALAIDALGNKWIATVGGLAVYRESGVMLSDMMRMRMFTGVGETGVEERCGAEVPSAFSLSQNYPNPFNPVTTIAYDLPKASEVELTIYNVAGQRVAILVSKHQRAGHYQVAWDGSAMASGVYFYRIEAGEFRSTRRMLLLK